jgi:hypothetical protein
MDPPLSVEEMVREFDQPNLNGWKLFSQSPGLKVYRRPNQVCCSNLIRKIRFYFLEITFV